MKNSYYFKGANPTVDLIVKNHLNEILLVKRKSTVEACPNMWALPGGFIDTEASKGEVWKEGFETSEQASLRELLEETNLKLDNPILSFVGIFEGNFRDPRDNEISWSKSHAFYYEIDKNVFESQKNNLKGMDDVAYFSF